MNSVIEGAGRSCIRERASAAPPHWSDDTIRPWDDALFSRLEPFRTRVYWTAQGSINVFRVIGTQHPDYQNRDWLWFLNGGKRMDQNLRLLASNPGYYRETCGKTPSMYYVSLDGTDWYVGADGNHRTCIARFVFSESGETMLHGVHLTDYRFDHELRQLWSRLQDVAREVDPSIRVDVVNRAVGREDTPGWKLDHFQPRVRYVDLEAGRDELLDADGVRRTIGDLREGRRFGPRRGGARLTFFSRVLGWR